MLGHKYSLHSAIPPATTRVLNAFWSTDNIYQVPSTTGRLESEPTALGVADLVQVGVAGELDHGRRSAHQHQGVVAGRRQTFPHHVLADEALTVLPVCNDTRTRGLLF